MLHNKSRTKPLSMILEVSSDPLTRLVGERSNECERSLWQNPNVGFASTAVHFFRLVCFHHPSPEIEEQSS
jgi:hypothetical protein